MVDLGAAIVQRLEGVSAWLDVIGERTDWTVSQPDTPFPRAVLTFITRDRPDHYEGPDLQFTRLQIDVYSLRSAGEAADVAEIALDALTDEDEVGGVRFCRAVEKDGPNDEGDQTDVGYQYRARSSIALMHANAEAADPGAPEPGDSLTWEGVEW